MTTHFSLFDLNPDFFPFFALGLLSLCHNAKISTFMLALHFHQQEIFDQPEIFDQLDIFDQMDIFDQLDVSVLITSNLRWLFLHQSVEDPKVKESFVSRNVWIILALIRR